MGILKLLKSVIVPQYRGVREVNELFLGWLVGWYSEGPLLLVPLVTE